VLKVGYSVRISGDHGPSQTFVSPAVRAGSQQRRPRPVGGCRCRTVESGTAKYAIDARRLVSGDVGTTTVTDDGLTVQRLSRAHASYLTLTSATV